jgi:hypothetical protein
MYVHLRVQFSQHDNMSRKSVMCCTLLSRFYVILKSRFLCQCVFIGVLSFLMHGFALLSCVFPVMWAVVLACIEVYRLPALPKASSWFFFW